MRTVKKKKNLRQGSFKVCLQFMPQTYLLQAPDDIRIIVFPMPYHITLDQILHYCNTAAAAAAAAAAAKSLQSCPTLCDPIDGSPPGSPIPEILQAGTLEWVAISFSNA